MMTDKVWHLLSRKLTQEASVEEMQELEQFLVEHPYLRDDFELLESFWEQEQKADQEYLEATYYLHCSKMLKQGIVIAQGDENRVAVENKIPVRKNRFSKIMVFGSVVLVMIITWGSLRYFRGNASDNRLLSKETETTSLITDEGWNEGKKVVVTKNGQNEKVQLPDGTQVWLNAGSRIEYDAMKGGGNREVVLIGEAFFDVVKNARRPFIIHTAKVDVRVLGTRFNLKAYPKDKTIETSLVQGSVEVFVKNRPGEKFLLKPNQKLVLLNSEEHVNDNEPVPARADMNMPIIAIKQLSYSRLGDSTTLLETSWLQKKLLFENEAFSEVAKKMERWYDVEILFAKKTLENEVLNGDFRNETLTQALDALRFTTDFTYKIEGKKVIIY